MAVLMCRESYSYYDAAGNEASVQAGDTLNDDHPAVRGHEAKFVPFAVTHPTPDQKKKTR